MIHEIVSNIKRAVKTAGHIARVKNELSKISPHRNHPVDNVIWVELKDVESNDYIPNSVANVEMQLLYQSIKHDGLTQPIVTVRDNLRKKYIIVDGFHRYFTVKNNKDLLKSTQGRLPIVVIKKDVNDRMASTIRHNRARGKHSINGMASMVFKMLDNGWGDVEICNELGMEAEELLRLKHITGFSKLFENTEYKSSWETEHQKRHKKEYKDEEQKANQKED